MPYIGAQPRAGVIERTSHTVTSGQTTFSATYTPGALDVYVNGILLDPADYTATNGTSVTILGLSTGDLVNIHAVDTFSIANTFPISGGTITGPTRVSLGTSGGTFSVGGVNSSNYAAGIDLVPVDSTNTSPFIRFYDSQNTSLDNSVVDDNNWAIGADDTGVSSFKIVYGGGNASTKITSITGASPALMIDNSEFIYGAHWCSQIHNVAGTASIGGTTTLDLYSATPSRGTYLIHAWLRYKGTAPSGDPDQCEITVYKAGTAIQSTDILKNDSSLAGASGSSTGLDDFGSLTVAVAVNGSQTLQVKTYTTDPGDAGGGDYDYRVMIYRIGG